MTQKNFKIIGIHCKSCKTLIEEEVKTITGVKDITVNHLTGEAELDADGNINDIYETIESLGYSIEKNSESDTINDKTHYLPIAGGILFFIIAFFLIQRFELFSLMSQLNEASISYGVIFIIGLLASFHCVGMCGGLILTYTTTSLKTDATKNHSILNNLAPHAQYNFGRLISYTIIGGILGGFGSFFGINPIFAGVTTLIVAIFMILMGLSLFSEHKLLNKIKLSTPKIIAKYIFKNKHNQKPKGPFIIGILTGFMPCGPLQAMQLFALASGSAFNGAIAMLLYSLGTIPLMFGFGTIISSLHATKIKQLLKFSGVLVILLGVFMINRGLINFGYGFKATTPEIKLEQNSGTLGNTAKVQAIEMDVTYNGYSPNVIYIKKDVPVRWVIKDKGITGCTNSIKLYLPAGTIKKDLIKKGETVIEFTPTQAGELKFSCWMSMVWGKFIVE